MDRKGIPATKGQFVVRSIPQSRPVFSRVGPAKVNQWVIFAPDGLVPAVRANARAEVVPHLGQLPFHRIVDVMLELNRAALAHLRPRRS